jgi:hypothetical protein
MKLPFGRSKIPALETEAVTAANALNLAQAEYDAALASIADPSPDLDDAQLGGLVDRKNAAELALVKAKGAKSRADRALNETREAEAAKEIADELARVTALGGSAQKVAREELTAATKGLRRAIRMMAEAEAAREDLNTKLPAERRIESFEFAVLGRPAIPEQVIARERKLQWVDSTGRAWLSPEDEARLVEDRRAGTATLGPRPGSFDEGKAVLTRRRYFERVTKLPEIRSWMQGNLAEVVSLPGLEGGPAGWNSVSGSGSVLRALDELEAAASAKAPERVPVESIQAISPVFKNNEELAAWDAKPAEDQSAEAA